MSWNLSELAAAQGRYAEAMEALDAYLANGPTEIEPYQKKIALLRKLGRSGDVVPTLKRYVARDEYHMGLQLLLAGEMAKDRRDPPRLRSAVPEAAREEHPAGHLSRPVQAVRSKRRNAKSPRPNGCGGKGPQSQGGPVQGGTARGRRRAHGAMLGVLRTEPELVSSLIDWTRAEVVRQKPREIDTWLTVAELAGRTHKLAEAELIFKQCTLGRLDPKIEYLVYRGLIAVLMMQKKYDDVVDLCRGLLASRNLGGVGLDELFHSYMAAALAELGRYEEALAHADSAIKVSSDKQKLEARLQKAAILAQAKRYDEAIRESVETMKSFPKITTAIKARYTLSNIYSLKGDYEKSEEQLRLILETDPEAPLANNNLGYQMADRNVNLDEAERLIRRAIESDRSMRKEAGEEGDNAAYVDSLGWVLFRKGKLDEGREWLEKAVVLPDGTDDGSVWDHLGDVYAKMRLNAKAKEAWSKAVRLYDAGPRRPSDDKRKEVFKKLKTVE